MSNFLRQQPNVSVGVEGIYTIINSQEVRSTFKNYRSARAQQVIHKYMIPHTTFVG